MVVDLPMVCWVGAHGGGPTHGVLGRCTYGGGPTHGVLGGCTWWWTYPWCVGWVHMVVDLPMVCWVGAHGRSIHGVLGGCT